MLPIYVCGSHCNFIYICLKYFLKCVIKNCSYFMVYQSLCPHNYSGSFSPAMCVFQGEVSYIRVKEDHGSSERRSGGRSRSRSYSPRRRGSPTYSPVRRSYSRSRTRSRSNYWTPLRKANWAWMICTYQTHSTGMFYFMFYYCHFPNNSKTITTNLFY